MAGVCGVNRKDAENVRVLGGGVGLLAKRWKGAGVLVFLLDGRRFVRVGVVAVLLVGRVGAIVELVAAPFLRNAFVGRVASEQTKDFSLHFPMNSISFNRK